MAIGGSGSSPLATGLAIVGLAAAIAASWFTGGASIALWAVSVAALGASAAIQAQAAQPEPISQVFRQLGTTNDPEAPWEWVYGDVVKGCHMPWCGIGGGEDEYTGADCVIACHPCDELLGVQVGDWYFPIVTSPLGDATSNTLGLILNANRSPPDPDWPNDWYVPVNGSLWDRQDQSDQNDPDTSHIGLKWRPGDQTVTDPKMAAIFGTKYSGIARKFIGHTVAHVILLVNTELGTMGQMPQILFRVKGKNDIQDHTGGNADYRTNCAHVFADYCRENFGIPVTEIVNLQTAATECDDTTWDPLGTAPRYAFNGVIRDDMEPNEALRLIAMHMAGGFFERGDVVGLWTGSSKTQWADGPLTPDDFAGQATIIPVEEDRWANTLQPHFVPRTTVDEDDKVRLYGRMEPTKKDVTSATYLAEDNGAELVQDIKFQACNLSRRAKFMAWSALKQMRFGAAYQRKFKKRAMVLEIGDVVALNDPDFVPNGTLFQVAAKAIDLQSFGVDLTLVRFANGIYNPDATVTEDSIGKVPGIRQGIMPVITGVAAEVVEDSAEVTAHGFLTCAVQVTWNHIPNILVRSAGDVRIAWKKTSQSWPKKSITVAGDQIEGVISRLVDATPYHIRVRCEGTPTAGRGDKPRGRWTQISFTPDVGYGIAGRPGTPILGNNEIANPNFKQKAPGLTAVAWEYETPAVGVTGSTEWNDQGGRFGSESTRIIITNGTRRIRPDARELIPAEVGQRWRFRFWRRITAASVGTVVRIFLNVQYYDSTGAPGFISSTTVATLETNDGTHGYELVMGQHTVPDNSNIKFLRLQAAAVFVNAGYTVRFDAFQQKRVVGATSSVFTATTSINAGDTGNGNDWEVIRSISVGTPGDQVSLSFSFEGRVGDPGSVVGTVTMRVRVQRFAANGIDDETNIMPSTLFGDTVNAGTTFGPWATRVLNCQDTTGVQGTFTYRAQFSTNDPNGQAQVRDRIISWKLEEEG